MPLTAADYRARAEEFRAMASRENDPICRHEYEGLAQCYGRLADLAERNSHNDVVYETPAIASSALDAPKSKRQPE